MTTVRRSAVAGLFYPASPSALQQLIENDLNQVNIGDEPHAPKALIVPHAGYIYSGPIAASAYKCLRPLHHIIKRVILIGPSHRVPFYGLALSSADYFETPLGPIPLDRKAISNIADIPGIMTLDEAHANEHSLEVQLPFLQCVLDEFSIVPIVVGEASPTLIAQVLNRLWHVNDTLIIISSDLSHYLDYYSAQQIDEITSQAIIKLDTQPIDPFHACGCMGINGLLTYAKDHALSGTVLDLRNSGDTSGKKDSVVGYGAYLFE